MAKTINPEILDEFIAVLIGTYLPRPSRRALGVHSASYLMGNGFLPGVKAAGARH